MSMLGAHSPGGGHTSYMANQLADAELCGCFGGQVAMGGGVAGQVKRTAVRGEVLLLVRIKLYQRQFEVGVEPEGLLAAHCARSQFGTINGLACRGRRSHISHGELWQSKMVAVPSDQHSHVCVRVCVLFLLHHHAVGVAQTLDATLCGVLPFPKPLARLT